MDTTTLKDPEVIIGIPTNSHKMIDSKKILEEAKSGSLKKWVEYILRWEGLGVDCTEFPKRRLSDEGEKAYRSYLKQAYNCFQKGCDNDYKGFILMRLVEEAALDSAQPRKSFLKPEFIANKELRSTHLQLLKEGCDIEDLGCLWYAASYYIMGDSFGLTSEEKTKFMQFYDFYNWDMWSQKTNELIEAFKNKKVRHCSNSIVENYMLSRKLGTLCAALFRLGAKNYLLWCKIVYRPYDKWDRSQYTEDNILRIREVYSKEIIEELPELTPEISEFYKSLHQDYRPDLLSRINDQLRFASNNDTK